MWCYAAEMFPYQQMCQFVGTTSSIKASLFSNSKTGLRRFHSFPARLFRRRFRAGCKRFWLRVVTPQLQVGLGEFFPQRRITACWMAIGRRDVFIAAGIERRKDDCKRWLPPRREEAEEINRERRFRAVYDLSSDYVNMFQRNVFGFRYQPQCQQDNSTFRAAYTQKVLALPSVLSWSGTLRQRSCWQSSWWRWSSDAKIAAFQRLNFGAQYPNQRPALMAKPTINISSMAMAKYAPTESGYRYASLYRVRPCQHHHQEAQR